MLYIVQMISLIFWSCFFSNNEWNECTRGLSASSQVQYMLVFYKYFYLFYLCLYVCVVCADALRGPNSYPDTLELELYMVISHLSWTHRTMFKSVGISASSLLRYLPFPIYASFNEFNQVNFLFNSEHIYLIKFIYLWWY